MAENTNTPAVENPSDIFNQRVAKVRELEAAGIAPYGQAYPDVQMIGDVRELFAKPGEDDPEAAGPEVNIAGRLVAKRGMGKSIFADVRDSSGRIQLFAGKSDLGDETFAFFKKLCNQRSEGVIRLFKDVFGNLAKSSIIIRPLRQSQSSAKCMYGVTPLETLNRGHLFVNRILW